MDKLYIGNTLKKLRQKQNLTLDELVEKLNIFSGEKSFNKGTISKWENGKDEPRLSKLKIISDFYDVSIDIFIEDSLLESKNNKLPKSSDFPDYFKKDDIETARAYLAYFDQYEARFYATGTFDYDKLSDNEAINLANELKRIEREELEEENIKK